MIVHATIRRSEIVKNNYRVLYGPNNIIDLFLPDGVRPVEQFLQSTICVNAQILDKPQRSALVGAYCGFLSFIVLLLHRTFLSPSRPNFGAV